MSLKKLGRYELVRVLGKGAMGLVYEGRDPNLERRVAIKTIKVENLSSEEAAEYEIRFRTEARSAARLQHPNIVSVYDSDRDGDIAYLVMEFIQGEDLKHHLDQGRQYTLQEATSIMGDLLSALDYAHRQHIVHRDIKPANLLIEADGRIKLTDFGVARIQDSGEATRTKGTMVGTLKYMSPEQLHGLPIDARSDLFSAGVVLYQLLTGTRPFDGTGDYEIIQKIVSQEAPQPSSINPQLPPAIDQLVARALEKSRDDRYPTAQEFNAALRTAAASVTDPTITPPKSPPRPAESSTWTSTVIKGESLVNTRSGSLSGLPSSTVTQEVELLYWKEIKDSVEIDEFQDYLLKFPSGIYADLARRRIKRLNNPGGEHGGLRSGTDTGTRQPAAPTAENEPTLKVAAAPAPPAPQDLEPTHMLTPRTDAPAPPPSRGRRRWLLGGAGLAIMAAIALSYLGLTRSPAPASGSAFIEKGAGDPSKAKTGAAAASGKAAPAQRAEVKPKAPATKPAATAAAPGGVAKTAGKAAPLDPEKACEGRVFLAHLNCMKRECDKPSYAQHPVCVQRRSMEQSNQDIR